MAVSTPKCPFYAALFEDFVAECDEEITVKGGEKVTVIKIEDDGWWTVRTANGKQGIVPGDFCDIIKEKPPPQQQQQQTKRPAPTPAASKPSRGGFGAGVGRGTSNNTAVAAPKKVTSPKPTTSAVKKSAPPPRPNRPKAATTAPTTPTNKTAAAKPAPKAGGWGGSNTRSGTPDQKGKGLLSTQRGPAAYSLLGGRVPPKCPVQSDTPGDPFKNVNIDIKTVLQKHKQPRVQSVMLDKAAGSIYEQVIKEVSSKTALDEEEQQWVDRVLDTSRKVHASTIVRLYICKQGQRNWEYTGYVGAAAVCTEADLKMECAHYIRIVDLEAFNPNVALIMQQEIYTNFKYNKLSPNAHCFQMNDYIAMFSFASASEAEVFYEKVQFVCGISARELVMDEYKDKETANKSNAQKTADPLAKYNRDQVKTVGTKLNTPIINTINTSGSSKKSPRKNSSTKEDPKRRGSFLTKMKKKL